MRQVAFGLSAVVLSVGLILPAMAADAPTKVRQELMKSVGASVKAGAGMVKGQVPFDAAVAQESLSKIHMAAVEFGEQFPAGSESGDETEASPKIWEDAAGWSEAVAKFEAETKAAADSAPTDLDAFKVAFGQVTGNCKGCHEDYRIKKN